jgi:hypothetical protein
LDRPTESNGPLGSMSSSFNHAMIELGVLGLLTLVLAVAIYLSRRSKVCGKKMTRQARTERLIVRDCDI